MKSKNQQTDKTLLIVGPVPPPIGGSPVTIKEMLEELAKDPSIKVSIINTSPAGDLRKQTKGVNIEKLNRMIFVLLRYAWEIRNCSVALVFANNFFAFTMVPLLLMMSRLFKSAFYIKPVGGDLDLYLDRKQKIFLWYLKKVLRSADGILAQTQQLQAKLSEFGCTNVHYLPGCRSQLPLVQSQRQKSEALRLLYLAHIIKEKGPLVLLEALQRFPNNDKTKISCDFFGPIHEAIRMKFLSQLAITPNVRYCGEARPGSGSRLMAEYDALVLPTFFPSEGHPGVLIEAMHAGIPVISTRHRAIPELVTNGENGILVPVKDPDALAEAIKKIAEDPYLRRQMGLANCRRGNAFRTDVVVDRMTKMLFP
jgi:glycosyltransferase involved in cell wall biosynthesis